MEWGIFRDQIWNSIGVIIAVVSVLITIVIYFLQKNRKSISYEILSRAPLLTTKEKIEGKIKLLFNDLEVQNVSFFEIKVINSGNVGIPSSDYERPLRFIFETEAKILTAEIIKSGPEFLTTELNIVDNEIVIQPILMNSKDYLIIKIIVSNSSSDAFILDGRIKDVKSISKLRADYKWLIIGILGLVLSTIGLGIFIIFKPKECDYTWPAQMKVGLFLAIIGYLFFFIYLFKSQLIKGRNK